MKFEIEEKDKARLHEWMDELLKDEANTGAIGGRFTFRFTPTGLGVITVVIDGVTEKELDLTDYDNW